MSTINLPRLLKIGGGAVAELPELLRQLQVGRPLLITDRYFVTTGAVSRLEQALATADMPLRVFDHALPDPTERQVAAATAFLLEGDHDAVIGFGGGSPIDTAKAVAVLARRGGTMRALKAPCQVDEPGLPIIAIPTTAGTGSEATRFTVITDDENDEKMLCVGAAFLPTAAIIDYELSLSTPRRLTADTGIDALTHAIEAYVSRQANPFSDGMALLAMAAIWPNLRTVCAEPDNRPAREAVMLGAFQAGVAFSNASVALVHGLSRPISAHFHVPHGLSNAMLLPAVTAFSAPAALERYARCAVAMGVASEREGAQGAVARLQDELVRLNADLEVPTPRSYGIDEARWRALTPQMARQALDSGSPANNPRVPTFAEIEDLYGRVWA